LPARLSGLTVLTLSLSLSLSSPLSEPPVPATPNFLYHHQSLDPPFHRPRYNTTYLERFQRFAKAGGLKNINVGGVKDLLAKSGGRARARGRAFD